VAHAADVGDVQRPGRLLAGKVMVNHERRYGQRAHGVGQDAEPAHVADVEHHQPVDVRERACPLRRPVADVVAQEEAVHPRPGCGIHHVRGDAHLRQESRERRLRPAAVAVGVDVGGERDRVAAMQLGGEPLDGRAAGGGHAERVVSWERGRHQHR